jgi:NADP-dependent 3-hydroxy acid dehydrogenase YdfG
MAEGKLTGQVAIVTGASSGIGRATAYALADEGAMVAIVARSADVINAMAEEISGKGGTASA